MQKIKIFINACLLFVFIGLSLSPITAQTTTSIIEGAVTDANGAVIAGATLRASGTTLGAERNATTDAEGFLPALPAGTYAVTVSQTGFTTGTSNIELTLNRKATFDVQLQVGSGSAEVIVTNELPLLETSAASTGATGAITSIFCSRSRRRRQSPSLTPEGDNANPVLGERSGNNNFFIDGHPNKHIADGGPAAQFNQKQSPNSRF